MSHGFFLESLSLAHIQTYAHPEKSYLLVSFLWLLCWLLNLSELQFLHLQNADKIMPTSLCYRVWVNVRTTLKTVWWTRFTWLCSKYPYMHPEFPEGWAFPSLPKGTLCLAQSSCWFLYLVVSEWISGSGARGAGDPSPEWPPLTMRK